MDNNITTILSEINLLINWDQLLENCTDSHEHKRLIEDRDIWETAEFHKYGHTTAKKLVDNLLQRGYCRYINIWKGGYLYTKVGIKFRLHSKVECDYAEMMVRRLFKSNGG